MVFYKISNLKNKYTVDAVVLDLGTTESLPKHFQVKPLPNLTLTYTSKAQP